MYLMVIKKIEFNLFQCIKIGLKYFFCSLFTLTIYSWIKIGMYLQRRKDSKLTRTSGFVIDGNIKETRKGVCIAYK